MRSGEAHHFSTAPMSQRFTVSGRYAPEPGSVINAAYRYARGSDDSNPATAGIEQVDLSSQ